MILWAARTLRRQGHRRSRSTLRELRAVRPCLLVKLLDQLFEIVFLHLDDAHLALRVLSRIGSVRGVDHDGLPEFAANRSRWRLGRIGRPEYLAYLRDRVDALVNQHNALFGARL